ncbi:probable WRKY transcription factor 46 [Humulus lupulus]|uniref:probable WRKY transcription factor 46 n=1 Tax=Humulus lupulus TaxID=3486 RepID=UPI002B408CA7|nr:probable WRKY transcription factor 46 [Humulus lupulus]
MEKKTDFEQKFLINELMEGKELAKQLMGYLQPSSSHETRDVLVEKILSSYEKALSVLNWDGETKPQESSPCSFGNNSPKSVIIDQDSNHRDVFKKRKTTVKSEQVKVCVGTGSEGHMEDGHSWRKYGQKDILGANHPRSYFRCTHRKTQGCLATKQVQRSDQDSSILEITYKGYHTCRRASQPAIVASSSLTKMSHFPHPEVVHKDKLKQSQEKPFSLEVKTEDLDTSEDHMFQPFSFASTPIESEDIPFFSEMIESDFAGGFSSPFISPTTSDSAYFSVSPCHKMSSFGLANSVRTPESDLTEILSAPTSLANSPMCDLDLSLDNVDFEMNFPFDSDEYFS